MTLNITIVNQSGAWQSSDHRITRPISGELLDDESMKHVILRCSDGSALVAYAGVGTMVTASEEVTLSDWVREILRGESRTVEESLVFIRDAATRDLGTPLIRAGLRHMFSVAAFIQTHPWIVQIRNFSVSANGTLTKPSSSFQIGAREISQGGCAAIFPSHSVSAKDWALLQKVCAKTPRSYIEFLDLLAAINERVADKPDPTVSPHCCTTYMPVAGVPFESKFHGRQKKPAIRSVVFPPMLLFGIDSTEIMRTLTQSAPESKVEAPELQRSLDQRAEQSVTPKNRLRRT